MRSILLLLPLAAAACAPVGTTVANGPTVAEAAGPARVAFVGPARGGFVMRMTDGARCRALRPEGVNTGWSATTTDCAYALPYTVAFTARTPAGRFGIEEGFGLAGQPRAEVYVTDTDGQRKLFLSPLGAIELAEGA